MLSYENLCYSYSNNHQFNLQELEGVGKLDSRTCAQIALKLCRISFNNVMLFDSMDVQDKHRTGEQVPNDDGLSAPQDVPAADGPLVNMRPWIFHARAFMIEYIFYLLIQQAPNPDDDATRTYKGYAERLEELLFMNCFIEGYMNAGSFQTRWGAFTKRLLRSPRQHYSSSDVQTSQGSQPPTQNGSAIYSFSVDPPELLHARSSMLEKISTMSVQVQPQPTRDAEKTRRKANAKSLEGEFFKLALTEDYMNTETLVIRIQFLIDHGFIPAPTSLRALTGPPPNLLRRRVNAFNMGDY
ncbi:hypothetical protein ACFE04_029143 [Oxalis oulophora]